MKLADEPIAAGVIFGVCSSVMGIVDALASGPNRSPEQMVQQADAALAALKKHFPGDFDFNAGLDAPIRQADGVKTLRSVLQAAIANLDRLIQEKS